MKLRLLAAAASAAVFFGAVPRHVPLTVYGAPSGSRTAGSSPQRPTAAVLPDGRTAAPVGQTIFVGTNPQGVALSPDGRFAVVSNDDARTDLEPPPSAPAVVAGYSLAVVDTQHMRITDTYHDRSAAFYAGVAVLADPRNPSQTLVLASDGAHDLVRVFDLDYDGKLIPEPRTIALPLAAAPGYAEDRRALPASIVVSPDGRVAYVVESLGEIVTAIDVASRSALHGTPVGLSPFGLAVAAGHLFVTNAGLASYRVLSSPLRAPHFALPDVDPLRASSLAIVPLDASGDINPDANAVSFLRMDPIPDGSVNVGGIIPAGLVVRADGSYAYAALSNVDRVAVISLRGTPRVADGLDLRLFPNAPYGTEPGAEALAADGSRLYVALGGLNAVAVLDARDPAKLHRLGLVPTGWYPSALALSHDGRFLYVTDAEGVDGWGMLQRIDLSHLPLGPATLSALRYNRTAAYAKNDPLVPPLRSLRRSNAIRHVIYLSVGVDSYDAMLGDLVEESGRRHGNGAPSFTLYPQSVTPNLHALARDFALADNLYAPGAPAAALQFATAGAPSLPVVRDEPLGDATSPLNGYGEDPEAYPRAGYLFNALARANLTFRDYGALLQVSGYRDGSYTLDVPALAALGGNVDLAYPAWNTRSTDDARAAEFVRDFGALSQADRVPDFTYVWMPTAPGREADADRAMGRVVDAVTHSPQWASTVLFIVPEAFHTRRDHVEGSRIYAIVVSPYTRRGFIDSEHLSIASVVKTEEEILGLPPLAVSDLLATDLGACFTPTPDAAPFQAIP
ncbi:MAG TPA: bifunctional YncE family protein/alkaline phosphatase family protein [Candidatus Tyrphobacter sp.]